jgi:RNA polymerase sigma factor (sigma-70 family)
MWSILAACKPGDPEAYRNAMNRLAELYWKPVYTTLRRFSGRDVEESKDLTQGFFLYIMDHDVLSRFEAEKGRFRTFLKGVLRNFISDRDRHEQAVKRGKGTRTFSLEDVPEGVPSTDEDDPGTYFDRQWILEVFEKALGRLRQEGGADLVLEYDVKGTTQSYEELAQRFGMKESDVRNRLRAQRLRLRKIVSDLVRETTVDPGAYQAELTFVLGARSS